MPLLVITGQVPTFAKDTDAFQETNITEIAAPTAKKVYYVSHPDELPEMVAEAFRIAKTGRPGPVLIDFTKDAQQAEVDLDAYLPQATSDMPRTAAPSLNGAEAALDEAAELLRGAKRPVIIVGYGTVLAGAEQALQDLLEVAPCPVVHTLPGKSALPNSHRCQYGMLGMHGFYVANWIAHHADLIISFGSRFDDRITGDMHQFAPDAERLIHFDIDPDQVDKVLAYRKLGVIGDLSHTLAAFYSRLQAAPLNFVSWHDEIAQVEAEYPSTYQRRPEALQAQYVLESLNDVVRQHVAITGQKVIYTTEVGDHQMWASQYLDMQPGWQFMTSSGQGAMGSGLPMAIGAQVADPEALVICLAGDGSMRFGEAEMETIWNLGLPVKTLVINNNGYGIVRMWNHRFYAGRETGVVKHGKNWSLLAQSNGFTPDRAERVTEEPTDWAACWARPCPTGNRTWLS